MRRKNAVVVMATQQISDIANSEIADVVLENCPTKILLPNAEAKNPGSREFYTRVGLNERELEILQVSIPKQHYYVVSKLGRRLVDLGVGKVALSWVGVNGREERQIVESVMEQFPGHVARRVAAAARHLSSWADYFSSLEEESQSRRGGILCARADCRAPDCGFRATAAAVEAGAFATEVTQLLNHGATRYAVHPPGRAARQRNQDVEDMMRNVKPLPGQTFGPITADINALASIVQGGQALAYSLGNLDAVFRQTYPGYGYNANAYYTNYRNWSQTSLDTTLGHLRAAGLQGQQLQSEQAVLNSLRGMAQTSDGRMQAIQVLGQINEQQVQQLMKLRELMMADMSSKQAYQAT